MSLRTKLAQRWLHLVSAPLRRGVEVELAAEAVPHEAPGDAIVVLGCPLREGEVSDVLAERLHVALALWRASLAPCIIVSGGATRRGARSEAAAMAEYLLARGVPAAAVWQEPLALSTAENAALSTALWRSQVGAPLDRRPLFYVATQPFHAQRSHRLFARHGAACVVYFAARGLQWHAPLRGARWIAREYVALAKASLRGT